MVSAASSITLFLAALISFSAPALAGLAIGGATVAQNLFGKGYVPSFNSQGKGTVSFVASSSQDGINGFKSGTYDIGVSAVAMSTSDEANLHKLTVPTAVLTLSLFTGTGATFSITGKQVASILLGTTTNWSQVSGSGLSGTIVFVTRSDNSGTTAVFSQFLAATNPGWKYIGEGPFTYPNKNVIYAKGSSAVLAGLKSSKATLAVLQTGIGKGGGLNELKVQNKAGNYVASTIGSGSFVQALPRVTPPPTASWHGVSLVYQIGVETYPIVSFLYTFYHVKYSSQTVLVKAFARFTLGPAGQGLNSAQYFYQVPSQYTRKSLRAIKKIN